MGKQVYVATQEYVSSDESTQLTALAHSAALFTHTQKQKGLSLPHAALYAGEKFRFDGRLSRSDFNFAHPSEHSAAFDKYDDRGTRKSASGGKGEQDVTHRARLGKF